MASPFRSAAAIAAAGTFDRLGAVAARAALAGAAPEADLDLHIPTVDVPIGDGGDEPTSDVEPEGEDDDAPVVEEPPPEPAPPPHADVELRARYEFAEVGEPALGALVESFLVEHSL